MLFANGIALDADGRVYIADVITQGVVRVNPDGTLETVAAYHDAGLDQPTSIAFGIGGTELTIDAANLAGATFEPNDNPGPALVAIDTPGLPLPATGPTS